MKYRLNLAQSKWCEWLGKKRSGSMNDADTKNSVNMTHHAGWVRHIVGVIGEKVLSILTGWPMDTTTFGKGDGGTDFPDGTQAKSALQKNKPNLLILVSQYKRKDLKIPKRYILVWVKPNCLDCEVLGQISRERFDRIKRFVKKGERGMKDDTWWVDNWKLEPINWKHERYKERIRRRNEREEVQLKLF